MLLYHTHAGISTAFCLVLSLDRNGAAGYNYNGQ